MSKCPGGVPTTTAIVTIAEPLLLSGNTTDFADFLRAYVMDGAEYMDVSAVLDAIVYVRAKRYSAQTAAPLFRQRPQPRRSPVKCARW